MSRLVPGPKKAGAGEQNARDDGFRWSPPGEGGVWFWVVRTFFLSVPRPNMLECWARSLPFSVALVIGPNRLLKKSERQK